MRLKRSLGQSTIVRDIIAPLEWVRNPRNQRVDNAIVSTYFRLFFIYNKIVLKFDKISNLLSIFSTMRSSDMLWFCDTVFSICLIKENMN